MKSRIAAALLALLMVSARMLVRYGWGRAIVPMIGAIPEPTTSPAIEPATAAIVAPVEAP